jgi:hypothetical protein
VEEERVHFVASLLTDSTASETAARARAESGWEPWEAMPCPPYVLQWFCRPGPEAARLPTVDIDAMTLWVPAERYLSHLAEHYDAGWLLFDDPPNEESDGSRIVIWQSPRLHALRNPTPPIDLPPAPPPAYTSSAYLPPPTARPYASEDWQSTIQSGMRTGAFAAFLDGLSGGDFFDL